MTEIQDAPLPADAQTFTVSIDRSFIAELRKRTNPVDENAERTRRQRWKAAFEAGVVIIGVEFDLVPENSRRKPMEDFDPGRRMGNPFIARLITGYGDNKVVVADNGITVTHRKGGGTIRWGDLTYWGADDLALVLTDGTRSLAIPNNSAPADIAGRIIDSAGRSRPAGAHD